MSRAHRRFAFFFVYTLAFLLALRAFAQERRPVETPPRAHVFGRTVDTEQRPLAGALVLLMSIDGEWAKGIAVPVIEKRYDVQGFETRTAADGRFEFDLPLPAADWIALHVEPDRYHDVASRDFGPAGGRDEPRLVAGENDLGTFELAATGAIAGRVLDDQHRPLAEAEVRLDGSFPGGMGRSARSDASGAFTIEHVPAGEYGIEALRDGYLLAKGPHVAVVANESVSTAEIVLAPAPTISGVVVDEQGAPIANARVWGWPTHSGTGAGARTDAQGRFTVALKQSDPHTFEVEADGYSKLEEREFGATPHAVGERGARLVLKRPILTTFVVLDAKTSLPITRYALILNWRSFDGGSRSGGEPEYPLADRPDGRFACEADPAKQEYEIRAPGYGVAKGTINFESSEPRTCLVRLVPEGVIRGRVMLDGRPLERAEIRFYAGSLVRYDEEDGATGPFDEQSYFWSDWEGPQDLVFVLPQPSKHWTERDGTFAFTGLASGEYRLEIDGPRGARRSLDPLAVFEGEAVDLGDVVLSPGANLQGRVVVPPAVDPTTIKLSCWTFDRPVRTRVDSDRTFRFEGVAAGKAHVLVDAGVGIVHWGKSPDVLLQPGSTAEITLDLAGRASVEASVLVRVNDAPAQGVRVSLRSSTGSDGDSLAETGADGRAARAVLAFGLADVDLRSSSGMWLGRFEKRLDLTAGGKPDATIDVRCGAIEIEWPALRADEPLYLVSLGTDLDSKDQRQYATAMPGFDGPRCDARILGERRARFAWAPLGEREWTVEIQTLAGNEVRRDHTFRRKLTVRSSETTECVLSESDRLR